MANNKIVYGDQTLIDLTSDTVTPETLAMGETAHSASGAQIVGTMSPSGPATPLTPSNASPATIVSGETYEAQSGGVAIESYSNIRPSDSAPLNYIKLTEDSIYKITNNDGYAVSSLSDITPPAARYATKINPYTPIRLTNTGYLISSNPETVQPSGSGTYITSGMKYVSYPGYLYDREPRFRNTIIWSNPSTSTSTSSEFAAQDITLSQSITNFEYIGIYWEHAYGLATTSGVSIWESAEIPLFSNTLNKGESSEEGFFGFYYRNSSSTSTYYWYLRNVTYKSDTSLHISNCWRMVINTSGTNTKYNSRIIPKYIYGYKVE